MLVASESLCAACGVVIFVLGLLCCFIPRHFKFGVLTLLLGDLFFACAIAFPRRIHNMLAWWGADPVTLEQKMLPQGVLLGLLVFALWYGLYRGLQKLLNRARDVATTSQENLPPDELPFNRGENDDRRFALDSIDKVFFQKSLRVRSSRKWLRDHNAHEQAAGQAAHSEQGNSQS